jgi:biotin synthesis protein BioG
MIQQYIVHQNHPTLVLLFAGWGADAHLFSCYRPKDADFMICYDYRSLLFDEALLSAYTSVQVIAWSMGVWAASRVLEQTHLPIVSACAVNGTIWPMDDTRGIPTAIFKGTLAGLNPLTIKKFQRRMTSSAQEHRDFMLHAPQRPLEELREELAAIEQQVTDAPMATFQWTKAWVGMQDRIIPIVNQLTAWQELGVAVEQYDEPHYSEPLFTKLFSDK